LDAARVPGADLSVSPSTGGRLLTAMSTRGCKPPGSAALAENLAPTQGCACARRIDYTLAAGRHKFVEAATSIVA
jgi:hypothetical protein